MLKTITKKQFAEKLKHRKLESLPAINLIENYLIKKRGYAFKMPKKSKPAILLISGGLDSTTSWAILMKEFGLKIYPLNLNLGDKRRKQEQKSIDFYSKYYAQKFPRQFYHPFTLTPNIKEANISVEKASKLLHPELLLKYYGSSHLFHGYIPLASFMLYPLYAKFYANYLYYTQKIKIRTIFCSATVNDGELVRGQTFTAMRSAMFNLCVSTGDYSWQYASAVFEKYNGLYLRKSDIIRWADRENIPLDKTWSCYRAGRLQCGSDDCIACMVRKEEFRKARVADRTIYLSIDQKAYLKRLKNIIKILWSHMK